MMTKYGPLYYVILQSTGPRASQDFPDEKKKKELFL